MRKLTLFETKNLEVFTKNSIEVALIEPTGNGLQKSILDAIGTVRAFLKDNKIHDYNAQLQGQSNKIYINALLITSSSKILSRSSLYRPDTKHGDPRIWFSKLNEIAKPNDILAIIWFDKKLHIVNITHLDIDSLINGAINNPLKELVNEINNISQIASNELLQLLRNIAKRGPIQALLQADTSVGRTLESLLGISINSSKLPDYKGIELKAYRDKRNSRKNLFAQVPDWDISQFKSSSEILDNLGYFTELDFRLYSTVSTILRNPKSLILRIDNELEILIENSNYKQIGDFVVWKMENLHKRLLEKHNETFWIAAESITIDGIEHFQYKTVEHTRKPIISQFDILLEQGFITIDHLIKRLPDGKAREKGPIFKIKSNGLKLLFPPSNIYSLTT